MTTSTKAISVPKPDVTTRTLHDEIIKKVIMVQNKLAEKLKKSNDMKRFDQVRNIIEIEKTLSNEVRDDLGQAKGDADVLSQIKKVLDLEKKLQDSAERELTELKKLQAKHLLENGKAKAVTISPKHVDTTSLSLGQWSTGHLY